ncbi:MAG: hypothetical protein CMO34_02975 [Verrucomicrobia bacterium]|nr:hypothetical protein [Verrucomicrobiota bacterium]
MQYVWFNWSIIILVVWYVIYRFKPTYRKVMLKMSLITAPFGLTEPLFVPEYWFPPSLFNLAETTGFDIESIIFSFSIGGIGAILYQLVSNQTITIINSEERKLKRHRLHLLILYVPPIIFIILAYFTNLNHIYCGVLALFVGALATLYCRPDLKSKIWIGGLLFTLLYFIYFGSILLFYPKYVELFWNLDELSGILIFGVPLEEFFFAFSFGMYWSSLYEHLFWKKTIRKFNINY